MAVATWDIASAVCLLYSQQSASPSIRFLLPLLHILLISSPLDTFPTFDMDVMMGMMPATAPQPQPSDMVIWFTRNQLYAKQVWWFVASFIGLVAIFQALSWVASKAFAPCPASRPADSEGQGMVRRRRRDWSRLPLAFVNYFRVVAFRNTVDIGQILNITYAEAFITVGYIVGLFVWAFINSALPAFVWYVSSTDLLHLATNLAGQSLNWQYWSGRAGTLAVSQFPLITVLGTKNNVLSCESMHHHLRRYITDP